MNRNAEQHLAKAKDYVARGEDFYRKAAEEIMAAQKADPTASNREIGEWFGRGERWVRDIVRWSTSSVDTPNPYGLASDPTQRERNARAILKNSTPAKIAEDLLGDPKVRMNVARALEQSEPKWTSPRHESAAPTFISYIVSVNSDLNKLANLVAGWRDANEIPPEFSDASFDDIAAKALRIKSLVLALRSEDNDEWQSIVDELRSTR